MVGGRIDLLGPFQPKSFNESVSLSPIMYLYLKEAVSKFVKSVFPRSLCFNGPTKAVVAASKCIPPFEENQTKWNRVTF